MSKNHPDSDPENPKNSKKARRRLKKLEARIEKHRRSEIVVAFALRTIHAEGLYSEPTFEAYVSDRWGYSKTYAYFLIKWTYVYEQAESQGHQRLPLTESEARPLYKLDEHGVNAVWATVLRRREGNLDGPITRAEVDAEVKAYLAARASTLAEDGVDAAPRPDPPPLVVPGPSPLVGAYGRVVGDPPTVEKGLGDKSEGLLVKAPGTLFERPTSRLHLVEADRLPFDLTSEAIRAMVDEAERMGLKSTFNVTNESVDWARFTWNPISGCVHDCVFCYARDLALRYYEQGFTPTFYPNRLVAPERTEAPADVPEGAWERRVFTGSMGDLFARTFPDTVVQSVLDAMARAPQWAFLLLTKLPARLPDFDYPPNVWVGTTVVDQNSARRAEAAMARVSATVRWVSLEPLLGPVRFDDPGVFDWFVIGAQTRTWRVPGRQPDPAWVYDLLIQADQEGVEVYTKENLDFALRRSPRGINQG